MTKVKKAEIKKVKEESKDESKPDIVIKKELDAKALEKIEKKKAKKLAQKLKKKLKKQQNNASDMPKTGAQQKENVKKDDQKNDQKKKGKNKKGKLKNIDETKDSKTTVPVQPNGEQKKEDIKTDAKKIKRENKKEIQKNVDGTEASLDPKTTLCTVFVGNLPVQTKRVQIAKLFAKFGGVQGIRLRTGSGQVLFKHKQRKQAGSLNAYVILKSPDFAEKALELNGVEFKGTHLRVTPADAKKAQSSHDPKRTIFVGNLKYTANEKKLYEIFSNCGVIDYIRCLGDGKNGCKGVAYVCFSSPEGVGLALELNETLLDERPIHVERYSTKKLGAKEARDKQASMTQKPKATGAQKRVENAKNNKFSKKSSNSNTIEKKKKSDFHGVKSTGMNKKKHDKKMNSEMRGLAKKIAPIIKKEKDN